MSEQTEFETVSSEMNVCRMCGQNFIDTNGFSYKVCSQCKDKVDKLLKNEPTTLIYEISKYTQTYEKVMRSLYTDNEEEILSLSEVENQLHVLQSSRISMFQILNDDYIKKVYKT